MRKIISGLVAAFAVITAGVAPAKACDYGCAPCNPCGGYVQPYAGYERLPNPEVQYHHPVAPPQYYYVEQGPTYTGPGDFAPRRVYREEGIYGWGYHHHHHYGYHAYRHYPWHHHHWHSYGYHYRPHVLRSYY
ncbi:MAG: hypothetical protein ABSG88_19875 [Bradyrhizobium sp.]